MRYLKIFLFGLAIWVIPFIVSFFFYDKNGITIDIFLFKTIMIVLGAITGGIFTILYLRNIYKNYFFEAIIIGIAWFLINIALDLIILVPLSKEITVSNYFQTIGLRYLTIPILTVVSGYLLEKK